MFGFTRTSWEDAWYGGVKRILSEYPYITSSYDVYHEINKHCKTGIELTYYQQQKMVSIMFYESFKENSLSYDFVKLMRSEYESIISDSEKLAKSTVTTSYKATKIKVVIPSELIAEFVKHCKNSSELKPIFNEYGYDLHSSETCEIYVLLDPPSSASPPDSDSKSSESDSKEGSNKDKWLKKEGAVAEKSFKKVTESYRDRSKIEHFDVEVKAMKKGRKSYINSTQMQFAKKIFNLLDISQDPKSDVVKNLFQGKIDDEKLSEVLSGNNRIHMKTIENQGLKPFKVVILGDLSGSMDYQGRINFQRQILKSFYYLFNDLLKVDDLEIYGHSGEDSPVLYKYHTSDYQYFLDTIDTSIPYQENYDGPVIQEIHKRVRKTSDKAVLFISLSDGQPAGCDYGGDDAVEKMKQILEKAKRDNFVTVGIGIQYMQYPGLYQYSVTINDLYKIHPIAQLINKAVKENLVSE